MYMLNKLILIAVIASVFGLGLAIGVSFELLTGVKKPPEASDMLKQEKLAAYNYPLLDPMRALQPQEDFIVVFRPLRLKLEEMVSKWAAKGVVVAIQMEYLNTGSYMLRRIEEGTLSFDQILEIKSQDRDDKWGEMYKLPVGTQFSLRQVLEKSLIESDNTAHKMLYRLVGVSEAQDMSMELNLEDLFDKEGKISAREYAKLLRSLYTSSYLSAEHSQMMLDLMTKDQVVKFLIRGLGKDTKYAHKFGESSAIYSYLDAGIVYVPNRPYVLVVMVHDEKGEVRLSREKAGDEIFEEVARLTHSYVAQGSVE